MNWLKVAAYLNQRAEGYAVEAIKNAATPYADKRALAERQQTVSLVLGALGEALAKGATQ